jgi:DNA replication protein DnaD
MIMEGWIPLYGEREIRLACNEAVKQGKDHKALAYIEKILSNKVQKIAIDKAKAEALKKKIETQEAAKSTPWKAGTLMNDLYDKEGRLKKL